MAEYFERKGLNDYMVEIGGEVRAKGQSSKKRPWRIGIDRPEEDVTARNRRLQMIAGLSQGLWLLRATTGIFMCTTVKSMPIR